MALAGLAAPSAHAQLSNEAAETLGRHLEAGVEAGKRFGEAGETLTRLSSGSFGGMGLTGSQRRTMARRVDAAMQPWRDVAENVRTGRGAMAFTVASQLLTLVDEGAAMLGSAYSGDIRGATSTAVSVAVEPVAVGAFTAIGTGVGATVGSFVPVLGNALGGVVGGAVGTVAGGYIGAYAYDKYVKELITRSAEGGIATLFDTPPRQQAMQARQAFLHQNASPEVRAEWDRMNAMSRSFGGGEGQVLDWERLPYVIGRQPPTPPSSAAAPAPEQQAALGDGVPTSFVLNQSTQINYPLACTVKDARVTCSGRHSQGPGATLTISLTGTVSGNTLNVENFTVFESATGCTSRAEYRGRDTIILEPGGRAQLSGSHTATQRLRGAPCPTGPTTWSNSFSGPGWWRPN